MSDQPRNHEFTLREASDATGRSETSLRRDLRAERFPNAYKVDGSWLIPAPDLVAAGILRDIPTTDQTGQVGQSVTDQSGEVDRLRKEHADMKIRLTEEIGRRETAEARAEERSYQLTDLRKSFAVLEAATKHMLPPGDTTPSSSEVVKSDIPPSSGGRRKWFRRRKKD